MRNLSQEFISISTMLQWMHPFSIAKTENGCFYSGYLKNVLLADRFFLQFFIPQFLIFATSYGKRGKHRVKKGGVSKIDKAGYDSIDSLLFIVFAFQAF